MMNNDDLMIDYVVLVGFHYVLIVFVHDYNNNDLFVNLIEQLLMIVVDVLYDDYDETIVALLHYNLLDHNCIDDKKLTMPPSKKKFLIKTK